MSLYIKVKIKNKKISFKQFLSELFLGLFAARSGHAVNLFKKFYRSLNKNQKYQKTRNWNF